MVQVRPRPFAVVTEGETAADATTAAAIGAGGAVVGPLLGRAGVRCWAESRAIRSDPRCCRRFESFPSVASLVCEQEGWTNRERKQLQFTEIPHK